VHSTSDSPTGLDAPAPAPRVSAPQPRWGRLTGDLFSFPVMCLFLLVAVVFAFSIRGIAEPDIWWHLRNAQYLLQHHALPRVDMYSFGAAGSPWLDHEWLSEVPFYLGVKVWGLRGMLAVYFAVLALIYAGVYYRTCRAGADCKNATVATLPAIFLGVVSIGPRMLLFGWLCMVGLLLILDRFERTGKGLWFLPPLFALWINLHGSWVFGMAVLGLTIGSGLLEGEWGLVVSRRWSPAQLKKLLMAVAVSLAALFLNPFGYRLVLYPFDLLFHQPGNMKYMEEWQSVNFNTGNGKLAMAMILVVLAAALFSRRRWRLEEVLLTVFALWAALSHGRFLFFAGLVLPPILGPRLKLFPPYDRGIDKPWLNAAIMAAVVGGLVFFYPSNAKLEQQVSAEYPTAALAYMQQHGLNGRIFNLYGWGGYMEWNAPELKPFIDGRADIFVYNGTFADYADAIYLRRPFETLEKYKFDYVLLSPKKELTGLLQHSIGWRVVYSDGTAVLFERVPGTSMAVGPTGDAR